MRVPKIIRQNNSGIILITVIMLTLVLSIIVVGIMSMNISQVQTGADIVNNIKAEQLATGILFKYHIARLNGSNSYLNEAMNMNGRTFNVVINGNVNLTTPNNTTALDIRVTY